MNEALAGAGQAESHESNAETKDPGTARLLAQLGVLHTVVGLMGLSPEVPGRRVEHCRLNLPVVNSPGHPQTGGAPGV